MGSMETARWLPYAVAQLLAVQGAQLPEPAPLASVLRAVIAPHGWSRHSRPPLDHCPSRASRPLRHQSPGSVGVALEMLTSCRFCDRSRAQRSHNSVKVRRTCVLHGVTVPAGRIFRTINGSRSLPRGATRGNSLSPQLTSLSGQHHGTGGTDGTSG